MLQRVGQHTRRETVLAEETVAYVGTTWDSVIEEESREDTGYIQLLHMEVVSSVSLTIG